MDQADLAGTPPDWLPNSLVSAWLFLDGYPWVLALVVAAGGLALATLARALILFWGLKVAARTRTDLDEKLVRLGAWVVALSVGYLGLVAVTESSQLAQDNGLVLKIELKGDEAYVSNYVEPGVNVAVESGGDTGTGFDDPDNLALAPNGDLYITEDDAPSDIWVARGMGPVASEVEVFTRLLDCSAETTGIYFDRNGKTLWVNSQHAGLNGGDDLTVAITSDGGN